jgi:hypothetical protein
MRCMQTCADPMRQNAMHADMYGSHEFSGFTIAGHILRSESIPLGRDADRLPVVLHEPLPAIRTALKHRMQKFLSL